MPAPRVISAGIQLLVEGKDAPPLLYKLLRLEQIEGVQVQDFGGVDELGAFLKALRNAPGFRDLVHTLGVIRDAETNPRRAFQSVCSALMHAGLPVPAHPSEFTAGYPRMGIFILPGRDAPGMLDTLCLESVSSDPAIECVNGFMACLTHTSGLPPANPTKARLYAFLASRRRPNLRLGEAAEADIWDLNAPAFAALRDFLRLLISR